MREAERRSSSLYIICEAKDTGRPLSVIGLTPDAFPQDYSAIDRAVALENFCAGAEHPQKVLTHTNTVPYAIRDEGIEKVYVNSLRAFAKLIKQFSAEGWVFQKGRNESRQWKDQLGINRDWGERLGFWDSFSDKVVGIVERHPAAVAIVAIPVALMLGIIALGVVVAFGVIAFIATVALIAVVLAGIVALFLAVMVLESASVVRVSWKKLLRGARGKWSTL